MTLSRKEIIVLGCVLLLAGFFRFWHITTTPPGLYPDEAMEGNNAIEALKTGNFKVFYPENNGREGLYMNIQAVFIKIVGLTEPWVLRLPSAIFGFLTVFGFFLLLYEMGGFIFLCERFLYAVLGTFFLATSFWHINFSRIGFRAITAPFFLVWALYFFFVALRKKSYLWAMLGGVSFGLGFYTYISFRIVPLLFLAIIPFVWKKKFFGHALLLFAIAGICAALPLGIYFLQHKADFTGRTSQISIFIDSHPALSLAKNILWTAGMFNIRGDGNWRHNISGHPELFWPVGLLFLYGLWISVRQRSMVDYIFLSWLGLALLPVVISNEGIPHALRAILAIPAVFAITAFGALHLSLILRRVFGSKLWYAFLLFAAVALSYQTYQDYFVVWAKNPELDSAFNTSYVAIGHAMNQLPRDKDKYVVVVAKGVDVRGIPMPAQTVMFITDSFLSRDREAKRIHYLLPSDYTRMQNNIQGAPVFFVN